MTTTPPEAPTGPGPQDGPPSGPRTTRDEVRDLARLRRSTTDKKIAGVAGGLARHVDVDPLVVRVVLVVLVFFGGAGLLVYGACWLLVPQDDGAEAAVALDDRTRSVALVVVGILAAAALLSDSWGFIRVPWPVVVLGAAALYLFTRTSTRGPAVPPAGAAHLPPGPAVPFSYNPVHQAPQVPHGTSPATAPFPGQVPPGTYAGQPGTWVAPRPRRRGPLLFWFTAALAALGLGVLGLLDTGGVPVAASAYPALVVAVCGAMLVVGAFYGRAGGLAAVGVLAVLVMAVTSVAERWEGTELRQTPTSAAEVQDRYAIEAGEIVLDLGAVPAADLAGRRIELDADVGLIEVVVPDDMDVDVTVRLHGVGGTELFGVERGGLDQQLEASYDGGAGAPSLVIDAELAVGEIVVRTLSGRTS